MGCNQSKQGTSTIVTKSIAKEETPQKSTNYQTPTKAANKTIPIVSPTTNNTTTITTPSKTVPITSATKTSEQKKKEGEEEKIFEKLVEDYVPVRRKSITQNIVIDNQDRNIEDYYEIHEDAVLGSGISGQVKICVHKETKRQYALKTLSKRRLKHEKIEQLKDEIKCMSYLDHPNILRVHEFFESKQSIYLVLELCTGGELLDRLHEQHGHHYSELIACRHIQTMLNAINYVHKHNIVHRDLKLENFLFENHTETAELKLIDFGLCQYFKPEEILHQAVGTPYYVAPEVLEGNYNSKCDIWSIGVISYMLLSGSPPFYGDSDDEILKAVRLGQWKFHPKYFEPVSNQAKDFVTLCLTRNVNDRPSASQLLEHEWFHTLLTSTRSTITANVHGTSQMKISMHSIREINDSSSKGFDEGEIVDNEIANVTNISNYSMQSFSTVESSNRDRNVSYLVIKRLDKYVKRSVLFKICMDVVAHTLLPEQLVELRSEFQKFDVSNTGEISMSDLRTVLEQFPGFKENDLKYIFHGVDIEQTGKISYHEFIAATVSRQIITEDNLKIAFEKMSNHEEYITAVDIQLLLGDHCIVDMDRVMSEVGLSTDALIDYDTFKSIMMGGMMTSPTLNSPYMLQRKKTPKLWNEDSKNRFSSRLFPKISDDNDLTTTTTTSTTE